MKMFVAIAILLLSVGASSAGSKNLGEITRYISRDQAMNLSRSQLALANNYIHSSRSESRKRSYVRSLAARASRRR